MSRRTAVLIGLAWRAVVALLLSTVAFLSIVTRWLDHVVGRGAGSMIARVLDTPVSGLNLILRNLGGGIYLVPGFPLMLLRYLAVGVPAYILLLYLPAATRSLAGRITRTEAHGA